MKKIIFFIGGIVLFSCQQKNTYASESEEKMIGVWTMDSVWMKALKEIKYASSGDHRIALDKDGSYKIISFSGCIMYNETGKYFIKKSPERPYSTVIFLPDVTTYNQDTVIPTVDNMDFYMKNDSEFVSVSIMNIEENGKKYKAETRNFYKKTGSF